MQQRESGQRSASVLNGDLIRLAGVEEKWENERGRQSQLSSLSLFFNHDRPRSYAIFRRSTATTTTEFFPTIGRHGERATAKRPRRMSTPTCAHLTPREPLSARLMTGRRFRWVRREPAVAGAYFYFLVLRHEARNGFCFRGERRLIEA